MHLLCARIGLLYLISILMFTNAQAQSNVPTQSPQFPKRNILVGTKSLTVEVADTDDRRAYGLMNRKSLADNEGMLFIFDTANFHCMWMKNTYVHLAVAFADSNGAITNIEYMRPHDETHHCASAPAKYALEMPIQWFQQHKIGKGVVIKQQ